MPVQWKLFVTRYFFEIKQQIANAMYTFVAATGATNSKVPLGFVKVRKSGTLFTRFQAIREDDGKPFLARSGESSQALRRDYEFGKQLEVVPGVARVEGWCQGRLILEELERVECVAPLPLPITVFMHLALDICETVGLLHEQHITHNAISPQYVI